MNFDKIFSTGGMKTSNRRLNFGGDPEHDAIQEFLNVTIAGDCSQ